MSATLSYPAETRTATGGKATKKLRAAGKVPCTLTKPGKPSQLFALDVKSANHLNKHVVHLCKLEIPGAPAVTALRAEVVIHCLSDEIQHIDLIEVDEKSEIKVDVAVVPDARDCPGVKSGGIVELRLRKVKVFCKANAIPDFLPLDLGKVEIEQTVLAAEIPLPKGVRLAVAPNLPVLTVVIPRQMLKAEELAAAAPTDVAAVAAVPGAPAAEGDAAKADPKAKGDGKAAAPAAKPPGDKKK